MAVYSEKDKTVGVICDFCGKIIKYKFQYYSVKFDLVEVDTTLGKVASVDVDRRCLDLDLCPECMDRVKNKVMSVINKREGKDGWSISTEKPNESENSPQRK